MNVIPTLKGSHMFEIQALGLTVIFGVNPDHQPVPSVHTHVILFVTIYCARQPRR